MRNWGAGDGRGWRCLSAGGGNSECGIGARGMSAVGDACQRRQCGMRSAELGCGGIASCVACQWRRYGGLRPASPVCGEGYSKRSACGRSSALTRRGAVLLHARVNCAPAKGCVWPVLAPAQAWVRAGGRGAGKFGMRNWVGMGLAARFCRRALPSAHARLCVPVAALCLGSRLSFSSLRKKRRLAIACVPVPPGRDRHSRILQCRRGYLPWRVHFGFARFWRAISTGDGMRGTGDGAAARRLCVFAQPHWLCGVFRRENAGAARPRLRQRVFDSLDSPHAAAGLCRCGFAPSLLGHYRRPDRL